MMLGWLVCNWQKMNLEQNPMWTAFTSSLAFCLLPALASGGRQQVIGRREDSTCRGVFPGLQRQVTAGPEAASLSWRPLLGPGSLSRQLSRFRKLLSH